MPTSNQILTGLVLDEHCTFTMEELCSACSVQVDYIIELVDEGIVEPLEQKRDQQLWYFSGDNLLRAQKARRLQQDLGINLAGAALILELMEEIDQLRARLQRLD